MRVLVHTRTRTWLGLTVYAFDFGSKERCGALPTQLREVCPCDTATRSRRRRAAAGGAETQRERERERERERSRPHTLQLAQESQG